MAFGTQSDLILASGRDIELPPCAGSSRIANMSDYHYNEMIKRLNAAEQGKICSTGYYLRRLWKKRESGLALLESRVYSQKHEQDQKADRSGFEKKHKKGEIGFRKGGSGSWGVYTDLLYDTYQKDWSKAYQLTFFYFFRSMDYLSNPREGEFFSYAHKSLAAPFSRGSHQLGEVALKEINGILGSGSKLGEVRGLDNHCKAPLHDLMYGVLSYEDRPAAERSPFRNGYGYWFGDEGCIGLDFEDFTRLLSMEVFAHMASATVVNAGALNAMKKYLPDSCKMFTGILEFMDLGMEINDLNNYYGNPYRRTTVAAECCVDDSLRFCRSLAKAHARIMDNPGEKIFLRGNDFLAKIAKAVLEQDENLFASTCTAHKDESYFNACAETLEKYGFFVKRGETAGDLTWLSLYGMVLLLTDEYLATKIQGGLQPMPAGQVFECSGNSAGAANLEIITAPQSASEGSLNGASISALGSLRDSSDSIVFDDSGDSFYKFLRDNFPFRSDQNSFKDFFKSIYDDGVCGNSNLNWIYGKIFNGAALAQELRPGIEVGVMKAGIFGAYKDKVIYVNQRLVLDSLESQESSFLLLLTLLHEYGHFLDDVLHERAGFAGGDSEGEEGMAFAGRFMEHSSADLFNENGGSSGFKFADLTAKDYKGRDCQFSLEISNLSYEDRKGVLAFSEFDGDLETGDLELPKDGTIIRDVEFSLKAALANYKVKTHQKFTKEAAAVHLGSSTDELEKGSAWPDFPVMFRTTSWSVIQLRYVELLPFGFVYLIKSFSVSQAAKSFIGGCMYDSHFGVNQYWHSMYPQLEELRKLESQPLPPTQHALKMEIKRKIIESIDFLTDQAEANSLKQKIKFSNGRLTNNSVREIILMQLKKWYERAIECRSEWQTNGNESKKKESHFYLGILCHVVQDSYVLAHSWRRYTGDADEFIEIKNEVEAQGMPIMTAADNGNIWRFQDYTVQESSFHVVADSPEQKNETQGAGAPDKVPTIGYRSAQEATNGIMKRYNQNLGWAGLKPYLESIYQICSGMGTMPSGGSHPWFLKTASDVEKRLSEFSSRFDGEETNYINRI